MSHTSPASLLIWAVLTSMVCTRFLMDTQVTQVNGLQLGAFLLFHLWSFDRFKCIRSVGFSSPARQPLYRRLRWNTGPNSGAFKRVMTVWRLLHASAMCSSELYLQYSYLIAVPMVMAYSIGFSAIKYQEGFLDIGFRGTPRRTAFSVLFPDNRRCTKSFPNHTRCGLHRHERQFSPSLSRSRLPGVLRCT
jgi:hypothetical protein